MQRIKLLLPFMFFGVTLLAQTTFPINGAPDNRLGIFAFTNATIHTSSSQKIEKATLLIRDGKIEAVGTAVNIPIGTVVKDMSGMTIYPGFIDIYSNYGLPEPKSVGEPSRQRPQALSNKKGAYSWNEALKPEFNASEVFTVDDKKAKELRKLGFGAVMTHQMDGISRGTGATVLLGDGAEQELMLQPQASHILSFSKGKSTQSYPNSLMGSIALLRQTYLDGEWYKNIGSKEETNLSLAAWNKVQDLPQIFVVPDLLDGLRASTLGKQFNKKYILRGNGDEYQKIEAMKSTGASFILPINFPIAYDLEDPYDAQIAEYSDLKHWELAPSNPARMAKARIPFSITTNKLKKLDRFHSMLQKAIKHGLSESDALKALTETPANLINAQQWLGTLQKGKLANFIICSGNIFEKKTKIYQNWVKGKNYAIAAFPQEILAGKYKLKVFRQSYNLEITNIKGKPSGKIIINDSTSVKVNINYNNDQISMSFKSNGEEGIVRLAGTRTGSKVKAKFDGRGQFPSGKWTNWFAEYLSPLDTADQSDKKDGDKKDGDNPAPTYGDVPFPFLPYGWTKKPKAETVLITGATVWTNEPEGILEKADLMISNGKITAVGKGLKAPSGAITIDGSNKHITSGVIDEHSHIAISKGVNEGSQASSAEVSISDVVNSEDVNIYRQLAGGVTAAQLLHGSANPIGGQSAIIKLRWGSTPEEMKIAGADGFIKFALGENVKQSNWGDNAKTRFPQTRMGVEQVFVDYFTRAQEYAAIKRTGKPFRKDLELEAIVEILESKRFITCHSYRQSEINMLMKVAEAFGFRVNTFTHILEGYKIADIMAKHGVGGSTFSDWWAYKYEVDEAIPHNAAIMHQQGVLTAINSDDAEMARRLNQEAAKAVKYGGVSEEDAWKMVSLNPAKLLHLEDQMGSLKIGKDADVVLWSDNPLSIYAKAEKTWVEGRRLFDREKNLQLQESIAAERARLIQKMIAEKNDGAETKPVEGKKKRLYHCNDLEHGSHQFDKHKNHHRH